MSPETLRTLAGAMLIAIPLWCLVVVLSFAVFRPMPRLFLAASPARPIAPIAPIASRLIIRDRIDIDTTQPGAGKAIHDAEKLGYTQIGKRGSVLTMILQDDQQIRQGGRG